MQNTTDNAVGFKIIQNSVGGYEKSYVNSSGNAVSNQALGQSQVYGTPIYTPPAPGGTTSTTPVVNSNNAQADYIAKMNSYNALSQQIAAQGQAKATQAQLDAQTAAQQQLQASETNLKQQGIDIQKTQALAQQQEAQAKADAAKAIGSPTDTTAPVGTSTVPPPQNTPQGNVATPNTTPQGGQTVPDNSQQGTALSNEQNQLAQIQAQKDSIASQSISLLNSVMQGTIPLTGPQQALITSLQSQLTQNEAMQTQANNAYTGSVTQAAFRGGGEYTPAQMAGTIQNAVSVGVARIQQLDNAAATTIANLENEFQKQNYDVINKQYDILTKQLDDKAAAIKDTYTQTSKAIQDERDYQMNVAKFNQTADQNAFENALKIEQQTFQEKQLAETKRHNMATETPQGGGNTGIQSTATMSPTGGVDKQSQEAVLAEISSKYGPMTATAIKGLADYTRLPSDFSVRPLKGTGGMSRADAVSLAQQLDPTYTEAGAPARQAYMKSLASGPIYNATIAANKAINHLSTFAEDVSKLGNTNQISGMNAIGQTLRAPFDPKLQTNLNEAKVVAAGLGDEMAKFFKGTGTVDVESIKTWSNQLSTSANPARLQGTVQGALDLFAGQIDVMNQAYTNTMGKAPDGSLLQPATIQTLSKLKDQGYKIDIPGVNYTDPIAYVKNNPEGASVLQSIREQFPELTPAQALQLAQTQ